MLKTSHENSVALNFIDFLKKEFILHQSVILELIAGLFLLMIFWFIFESRGMTIDYWKVFFWCYNTPIVFYFSITFIISGTFLLLSYTVFTAMIETFFKASKMIVFIRSIMFMLNCIPIYIFTDFCRFAYGYEEKPFFYLIFIYGLAALILGNAIWLYVHRYFVESLKNELQQNYFETANALGFSTVWTIWPKIRLLLLDVVRSILLVLLGCSIFIESRFRYPDGDNYLFEGIGYLFSFDLNQMAQHDYEMILGIILYVLLFSSLIQFIVNKLQHIYNPEVRFGK